MIKTIETCDICGREGMIIGTKLPMFRTFDSCDGRTFYKEPMVIIEPIDICPDCLKKCTNIHDKRVMGYGNIRIEINPVIKSETK